MFVNYREHPEPEKISLYHYDVTGFSDGEPVCIGGYGYYNTADENVYIEEYGPGKKEVKKTPIPPGVEKTKDSIIEYLRKNTGVYIPG